jgi:hypothetical protein
LEQERTGKQLIQQELEKERTGKQLIQHELEQERIHLKSHVEDLGCSIRELTDEKIMLGN